MFSRLAHATPRPGARGALVILMLAIAANQASAQRSSAPQTAGDSALYAGDLARADSLYYIAVRYRPRDPIAREALGRYLGMRGASRIAAVLLEEARLFGGDPTRIAAELAPLYFSLGDWRALLTMPSSPLSASERKRVAWFTDHAPATRTGTGAQLLVGGPVGDTLGRVAMHIGARAAMAVVVVSDVGVTVGARLSAGVAQDFPGGDSTVIALDSLTIGALRLFNLPATLGPSPQVVTIGMSALGPSTPTFDYGKNRITFNGLIGTASLVRLPLLRDGGELLVLDHGRWIRLSELAATVAKARQALTIDFRIGEVRVQP